MLPGTDGVGFAGICWKHAAQKSARGCGIWAPRNGTSRSRPHLLGLWRPAGWVYTWSLRRSSSPTLCCTLRGRRSPKIRRNCWVLYRTRSRGTCCCSHSALRHGRARAGAEGLPGRVTQRPPPRPRRAARRSRHRPAAVLRSAPQQRRPPARRARGTAPRSGGRPLPPQHIQSSSLADLRPPVSASRKSSARFARKRSARTRNSATRGVPRRAAVARPCVGRAGRAIQASLWAGVGGTKELRRTSCADLGSRASSTLRCLSLVTRKKVADCKQRYYGLTAGSEE